MRIIERGSCLPLELEVVACMNTLNRRLVKRRIHLLKNCTHSIYLVRSSIVQIIHTHCNKWKRDTSDHIIKQNLKRYSVRDCTGAYNFTIFYGSDQSSLFQTHDKLVRNGELKYASARLTMMIKIDTIIITITVS